MRSCDGGLLKTYSEDDQVYILNYNIIHKKNATTTLLWKASYNLPIHYDTIQYLMKNLELKNFH